jgi:YihY family inner membrane protein
MKLPAKVRAILRNPLGFVLRVLRAFRANQGLLLSGAVAYYTLLSIVPMFALILVILSQVMDQRQLLETARTYLELVAADQSEALIAQVTVFLENWKLVGVAGLAILLFFSSFAFTVLENAMSVIFHHRVAIHRRHFLISAILPYFYILLMALGLMTVSVISAALNHAQIEPLSMLGYTISLSGATAALIYLLGVAGEALLLTSLYLVMPVGKIAFRHAVIGGVTATLLWEGTRHLLVWYFATLSLVNIVYGSFASAIVILLSFEAAAIILLLGAQVIAEYERLDDGEEQDLGLHT